MAIGRENKRLTRSHAPITMILGLKVGKLPKDSIVRHVCKELGDMTGTTIEAFDQQTVLSVIKKYHSIFCPKLMQRKQTRARKNYDFTTSMIERRRRNGSL